MGFDTSSIVPYGEGYLVEHDIFIAKADLEKNFDKSPVLNVAKTEQYRTTNLVTGFPRTITIAASNMTANIVQALDEAIMRYNNLRLDLTFTRVSGTADITLRGFYEVSGLLGYSGSSRTDVASGFPSSTGNPAAFINLNTYHFTSTANVAWTASVIQHELGHAIGFRHTDYMDRSYSCGGDYANEGPSVVGAIHIPGTPTGAEAQSFMLACSSTGQSRSFLPNDVLALAYLYNTSHVPRAQPIYEFFSGSRQDRALTTNANYQLFYSGWTYIGFSFRAFIHPASGTTPIYEYVNNSVGDHTFSSNPNDPNILSFPGWQRVGAGPAFYVYSSNTSGTIPIYRYYNVSESSTLFTSNPRIHLDYAGWTQEGIAWYGLPAQ
ncbi:hypothetical protein GCM10009415_45800 [Chitinophaga japonensis]